MEDEPLRKEKQLSPSDVAEDVKLKAFFSLFFFYIYITLDSKTKR